MMQDHLGERHMKTKPTKSWAGVAAAATCSAGRRRWIIDFRPYHGRTWAILPCLQLFEDRPNFALSLSWIQWDLRLLTYIEPNIQEDRTRAGTTTAENDS